MTHFLIALVLGQVAPPAEVRTPVEPILGSLVIVGGGGTPDSARKRFMELAGGSKARLVVIPTASADKGDNKDSLEPWAPFHPASAVILHTRDRMKADDPAFVKPLTDATGVWFGGGDQRRIIDAYRGTKVEHEIKQLLARGGVAGGTSAGAAIMTPLMIEGGTNVAKVGPGLGLLPGVIVDQHFFKRDRASRLQGAIEQHAGYAGIGIDEGTAIVVKGRSITVLGKSEVGLLLPSSPSHQASMKRLKEGDKADLVALSRSAIARKSAIFPPTKMDPPRLEKGSLIIGGGGGMSDAVWKRFIELAGGPEKRIVVIPTALEDPIPPRIGEARALERAGAKNVVVLHTRSRKEADKSSFWEPLKDAGGVWFSGGRQWRFVDAYEDTETLKAIRRVLSRGGVIGGSSAGASIQSDYMPRGDPLGNLNIIAEGYEKGFGFLKGVAIDQHFFARKRLRDMSGLMKTYPQLLGIGIDEGTVALVQGQVMEVLGKSKIAVYDRNKTVQPDMPDHEELSPGARYDLVERKRLP